jgi:aminoglycoside phosphotransferase (APT) family kinase protein
MLAGNRDLAATRERLQGWLAGRMPEADDVVLSDLKKPSAGLSNETLLFEAAWRERGEARSEKLVARLQPTEFQVFPEYDLGLQYRILEALAPTVVPVPPVRWYERDRSVLGCEFYVMGHVAAEIPSEVPPYHCFGLCFDATPERRAAMWWSGIDAMARIHALDWRSLGLSFLGVPGGGTDPLDRQISYWERYLQWARAGTAQPVLEATLAWLKANRYTPARVGLCWGDARMPNMMFRDDRVVAVLDCSIGRWPGSAIPRPTSAGGSSTTGRARPDMAFRASRAFRAAKRRSLATRSGPAIASSTRSIRRSSRRFASARSWRASRCA